MMDEVFANNRKNYDVGGGSGGSGGSGWRSSRSSVMQLGNIFTFPYSNWAVVSPCMEKEREREIGGKRR